MHACSVVLLRSATFNCLSFFVSFNSNEEQILLFSNPPGYLLEEQTNPANGDGLRADSPSSIPFLQSLYSDGDASSKRVESAPLNIHKHLLKS